MKKLYREIVKYWQDHKGSIPWDEKHNGAWTKWIKKAFYLFGREKGFKAEMSKHKKHGEGEYLIDVCWWKEKKGKYWLELALESEWNDSPEEIDHDFFKLMDIKSPNKIWLCSYGKKIYKKRKLRIIKSVKKARFRFGQEKYLIINLPDSQSKNEQNRLTMHAFWLDHKGNEYPLDSKTIERYKKR